MSPADIAALKRCLGSRQVLTDSAAIQDYAGDKWHARHLPEAVALPGDTAAVAALMRFAHRRRIPITPRGAGHGYVGGCVPTAGGIVLSLEGMNRIREIHRGDFVAVVEAGVVTKTLQEKVERLGLYYPPDPASRADSSIGGNIATNAGGPRCLKYGVTRDYILGLEVVRADGKILVTGSRTHKNKTGFDLARYFVGTEGLLGVVTAATLKLLPLPPYHAALSAGFGSMTSAARAIRRIFRAGFLPCALEIADGFTLEAARRRTGREDFAGCQGHLIVELDGQEASVVHELARLRSILSGLRPRFLHEARGSKACEAFWQLRREFSYALRDTGLMKINEDIVVPRSRLEDLFRFAAELQKRHDMPVACFGHAGDGNIHVNLMVDTSRPDHRRRSRAALNDLFRRILEWGGVITGEHGIGLAKKNWWNWATSPAVRQTHREIKDALDPHHLLNPGKFL